MPQLDLPPDLYERLAILSEQSRVTPSEYVRTLLRQALRLPDPVDWLDRLSRAAKTECRAMLDLAKTQVPSEEAIPAWLPLSVVPDGKSDHTSLPRHTSAEDSQSIFLELVASFYLDICAQDPAQPRTGEIAALETCLAERYFYCVSFQEFRNGLLLDSQQRG